MKYFFEIIFIRSLRNQQNFIFGMSSLSVHLSSVNFSEITNWPVNFDRHPDVTIWLVHYSDSCSTCA